MQYTQKVSKVCGSYCYHIMFKNTKEFHNTTFIYAFVILLGFIGYVKGLQFHLEDKLKRCIPL
jgi:predicted nucleic acid-binding Zn ribbon protein